MKIEIPDEDPDLITRALEQYYAYTVARKADDARYRDVAERLKRKPAEKANESVARTGKESKRRA
jgi:hypothetical protein